MGRYTRCSNRGESFPYRKCVMSQPRDEIRTGAVASDHTRPLQVIAAALALLFGWQLWAPGELLPSLGFSKADVAIDSLPSGTPIPADVRLVKMGRSEERVTLKQVAGSACHVLVFFQSTCPACEAIAPLWSDIVHVKESEGEAVPVTWIAIFRRDEEAAAFVRRHRLNSDWYSLAEDRDRRALGIQHWPQIWLISDGVLRARLPRTPEQVLSRSDLGALCKGGV
jgi:hypothetical protein